MLMAGLNLSWQRRRWSSDARVDALFVLLLTQLNLGKGYFSYDGFTDGPSFYGDACRGPAYTGGGYVTSDGFYDWWTYGARAAKRPIDVLEGDVPTVAFRRLAPAWKGKMFRIPSWMDNSAMEFSLEKGGSKAPRLNDVIKELFWLQVFYGFITVWTWLSSEANETADHFSRGRIAEAMHSAYYTGLWHPGVVPKPHADVGRVRVLPENRCAKYEKAARDMLGEARARGQQVTGIGKVAGRKASGRAASAPARSMHRGALMMLCFFCLCSPATALSYSGPSADCSFGCVHWMVLSHISMHSWQFLLELALGICCGSVLFRIGRRASYCRQIIASRKARRSFTSRLVTHGGNRWLAVMMVFLTCMVAFVVAPRAAAQSSSVPASRASIYTGLPLDLAGELDTIVHNRLSTSSWRTVESGVKLWRKVCEERGWHHIITTDDPDRGGKLVTFVMSLLACTTLTWGTIQSYVWGVRKFQQLQHQADPVMGIDGWTDFMLGIQVLTFEISQPRKRTPIRVIYMLYCVRSTGLFFGRSSWLFFF